MDLRRHFGSRVKACIAVGLGLSVAALPALAQTPEAALAQAPGPVLVQPSAPYTAGTQGVPTLPNSNVTDIDQAVGSTKTRPAFFLLPRYVPGSEDWSRPYADALDAQYAKWVSFKDEISAKYNLTFGLDYSFYPQWGTKSSPVYLNSFYPYATWKPFTNTPVGSGQIDIVTSHQAYFSDQNTSSQASKLGLITFANDWTRDNFAWSTMTYKHTLPGDMSWLSVAVGQYNLFSFDPSQYAANAQTSFIGYSFSQDATQTFPNAGFGTYAQVKAPNGQFNFAGGVQGGTDLNGGTLTTDGFDHGQLVSWANAQWTPTLTGLGAGIYSLLIYEQPFVPGVSSRSTGISLSLSQALTERYGAFLRVSNATGPDIPIRTSVAAGGVWNNPIGRNRSDQLGFAVGWNKTNHELVGDSGVRDGEWATELFYKATIFKGMHVTPDVQVFWNPGLMTASSPVAVFTLRTTISF